MGIDQAEIERLRAQGADVGPTVEQVLEGEERVTLPPPTRFSPARLDGSPELPEPGIYFGVPDSVYHSWPALSCSGIRRLAASPTLFYMTTPWLNASYEEPEEKAWANIGRAYHARILEGSEAFNQRFCVKLEKSAIPDLCVTIDDIKERIDKVHGKVPFGKRKEDFVAQLLDLEPDAPIWEECQRRHEEENAGRCQLSYEVIERIEIAARMIEKHEELSQAVRGGYPEVSLLWVCAKTGVPMKARVDYLKLKLMVDLKSYENKFELSPEQACRKAIANNRYPLQPSVYLEGAAAVKKLIRDNAATVALWLPGLGYMHGDTVPEEYRHWALKWAWREEEPEWLWIMQQKGVAPITRGIFYPKGGTTRLLFDEIVSRCKKRFRQFSETFGTDTWLDLAPIDDTFADEDIPPYASEI